MTKVLLHTDQTNPAIKEYVSAVEKGKKNEHVLFYEGNWIVKRLLDKDGSKAFKTKKEAREHAVFLGRKNRTSVFIHTKEGRIQERIDF